MSEMKASGNYEDLVRVTIEFLQSLDASPLEVAEAQKIYDDFAKLIALATVSMAGQHHPLQYMVLDIFAVQVLETIAIATALYERVLSGEDPVAIYQDYKMRKMVDPKDQPPKTAFDDFIEGYLDVDTTSPTPD